MHKKWRKIISRIGYVLFFAAYFYILFVNLSCSFLMSVKSKAGAIFVLIVAIAVAVLLPGIICWQHYYIKKLEKMKAFGETE